MRTFVILTSDVGHLKHDLSVFETDMRNTKNKNDHCPTGFRCQNYNYPYLLTIVGSIIVLRSCSHFYSSNYNFFKENNFKLEYSFNKEV